uniref:Uncharacterized protein n=1 Tax=Caenorhabditis japonica TaxID=281687 RepID=A0A8R1INN8_CAEJA
MKTLSIIFQSISLFSSQVHAYFGSSRSVSSTYIPQHQAVYAPTTSDRGGVNQGKKPTNTHLISRT